MQKNQALRAIADALIVQTPAILEANAADLAAAQENHMTASLQDRLRLTKHGFRAWLLLFCSW